jgi:multidrug efflux pump subunit AcrA (membrane-fusion protein)
VEEKNNVVLVPTSALSYQGDKAYVTLANGQKKEVTTGMTDNASTEIVSGLSEKESVTVTATGGSATMPSAGQPQGQGSILNSLFRSGRTR